MELQRVVLDNSAVIPAYFPESQNPLFDAGLITNRSRSLLHAIRTRRVNAFVPPSFFREFLNVSTRPLFQPGQKDPLVAEGIRSQWDDLLSLPLVIVDTEDILHRVGGLVFDAGCPAADAWYVAAAMHAQATFWMSHEHGDGLAAIAAKHVPVGMLSKQMPAF